MIGSPDVQVESARGKLAIMHVLGIGSHIIECPRIGRVIQRYGETFLVRVFTSREIQFCQRRVHAVEHFSALWAAKEAILESLGLVPGPQTVWTEIDVHRDGRTNTVRLEGRLRDRMNQLGIHRVMLSLAHCRTYATAYALALGTVAKPS